MKKADITAMVLWAKDRALDDLYGLIDDCASGTNLARLPLVSRKQLYQGIRRTLKLLTLPDNSLKSLAALRKAGYWNGYEDTYWETEALPTGYEGQ